MKRPPIITIKREQLEQIARKQLIYDVTPTPYLTVKGAVAAMEEAVALAVERCAQICDEFNRYDYDGWADECAATIRAELGKK